VEYWVWKAENNTFYKKMLSLHFSMILIRKLFPAFTTQKTTSEQENQRKKMRFEFHFLETHHSTIPLFHHSNCE